MVATLAAVTISSISVFRNESQSVPPSHPTMATLFEVSQSQGFLPFNFPLSSTVPDICQNFYQLVCRERVGEARDPTGYVRSDIEGERQALKLYKEIIQRHPNWDVEQIEEELVRHIFDSKHRARFLNAYRWVKKAIEHLIDKQPRTVFTDREKKQIKSRLNRVQLQIPPPARLYADEPDLLTKNEVYYERMGDGRTRLRVGGAYMLIAKSWFNLIFTLAHELGHSIDPCEIRNAGFSFPAYDQLSACFIHHGFIATRKTRTECGADDQLSEAFADWVAVEVTADSLKQFSTEFHGTQVLNAAKNAVMDLCDQDDDPYELDLALHPAPQIRMKIFAAHPVVSQLLGCNLNWSAISYCPLYPGTYEPYSARSKKEFNL